MTALFLALVLPAARDHGPLSLILAAAMAVRALAFHDRSRIITAALVWCFPMFAENAAHDPGVDTQSAAEFRKISSTARHATEQLRQFMTSLHDSTALPEVSASALASATTWKHMLETFRAELRGHGDHESPVALLSATNPPSQTLDPTPNPEPDGAAGSAATPALDLVVINQVHSRAASALRGGKGLGTVRERLAAIGGTLATQNDGSMFITRIRVHQFMEVTCPPQ